MSVVIMPSGVPADLGAGASLGDLSVGDAGARDIIGSTKKTYDN